MNIKTSEKLRKSIWVILMVLIFIIPLVVTLKIVPIPKSLQQIYNGQQYSDLFAYGKAQLLHVGTILALILTIVYQIYSYKKEDWKKNRVGYILLGLFAISIIISYLLSDHKELAWAGMIDRYEGTLTWLCYIGLTYITMSIIKTRKEINGLIISFVLSASVVSIIGAFQLFDMDFFKTDIGMLMMLGSRYEELFMKVNFNSPQGRVYSTVYNANYVASLIALSFPLTLYSVVGIKKCWIKIFFVVLLLPQVLALIGSRSTGGMVTIAMTIGIISIYLISKFSLNKMIYVGIGVLVILGYLALTQLTFFEPYYHDILKSLNADSDSNVTTEFASVEYNHPEIRYYLQNGESISISPIEGGLDVSSEGEGEILNEEENDSLTYRIKSDNYLKQVMFFYKEGLVSTWVKNLRTEKTSESRFNYYYTNHFSVGTLPLNIENYHAESIGWFNNEQFMTQRGYIWNRTIPMMLKKPIFGFGADTYTANFPQGDLMYKQLIFHNHTVIVDKPHNMFLNIALNFGLLGLILFFALSLYTMIRSRLDFLVISTLSYYIIGLVNDSVVFCTYMLFILFGLLLVLPQIKQKNNTTV